MVHILGDLIHKRLISSSPLKRLQNLSWLSSIGGGIPFLTSGANRSSGTLDEEERRHDYMYVRLTKGLTVPSKLRILGWEVPYLNELI